MPTTILYSCGCRRSTWRWIEPDPAAPAPARDQEHQEWGADSGGEPGVAAQGDLADIGHTSQGIGMRTRSDGRSLLATDRAAPCGPSRGSPRTQPRGPAGSGSPRLPESPPLAPATAYAPLGAWYAARRERPSTRRGAGSTNTKASRGRMRPRNRSPSLVPTIRLRLHGGIAAATPRRQEEHAPTGRVLPPLPVATWLGRAG